MNRDPPPGKLPVQKAPCDGANVDFISLIFFYLVLHIKNCFEQLDVDEKTEKQLHGSPAACRDAVLHSIAL